MQQRASVPVDGERVAELTELEVDDVIEDEVERDVDAGHAHEARLDDDRQAGRRYQSWANIIYLRFSIHKQVLKQVDSLKHLTAIYIDNARSLPKSIHHSLTRFKLP